MPHLVNAGLATRMLNQADEWHEYDSNDEVAHELVKDVSQELCYMGDKHLDLVHDLASTHSVLEECPAGNQARGASLSQNS